MVEGVDLHFGEARGAEQSRGAVAAHIAPRPNAVPCQRHRHAVQTRDRVQQTIEIRAVDYAFADLPVRVAAGMTLSLRNDSTAEVHEIVAFKLPDGEGRSVDELLQLPESELDVLSPAHRTS
jgi:hypothetical protein